MIWSKHYEKKRIVPEHIWQSCFALTHGLCPSRPEFDRYARYKSHGSVREIFDWNELCAVELPVPSIEEQKNVVKAYKTITERIELKKRINDNLAA